MAVVGAGGDGPRIYRSRLDGKLALVLVLIILKGMLEVVA
jgi:hypothetical protein